MRHANTPGEEEFVTIIGRNADEISRAFRAEGLAERQFSIVHRMGRHRFALAEGEDARSIFDGETLLAATYVRRAQR
jgi:hypothetical protein